MRTRIVTGGMLLALVGLVLAGCGIPQSDIDAVEAATADALAATATLQLELATAEATLAAVKAEEATLEKDAVQAAWLVEDIVAAAELAALLAAGGVSFDALTYTDETYGFSIQYPDHWVSGEKYDAYERLADADQYAVPSLAINPEDFEETEPIEDHRADIVGGENFDVMLSETEGVLPDGTAVMIYEYHYLGDYPGTSMAMYVDVNGTNILFVAGESDALFWGVEDFTASALEMLLSLVID